MLSLPPLPSVHRCQHHFRSHHHQAACTHISVTRLFGSCVTCQVCRRNPKIGWVYACTQDHEGDLPETGLFAPCTSPEPKIPISEEPASTMLSPWIQKAIDEGHYTEKEIEILKAQKLAVRDAIAKAEEALLKSSITAQPSQKSPFASPIDLSQTKEPPAQAFEGNDQQIPRTPIRVALVCHARICHACRTTFHERSTTPLNNMLKSTPREIPEWELKNRRISDVDLVKELGGRRLRRVNRTITDIRSSDSPDVILYDDEEEELGNIGCDDPKHDVVPHDVEGMSTSQNGEANQVTATEDTEDAQMESIHKVAPASRSMLFSRGRSYAQVLANVNGAVPLSDGMSLPQIAEDVEGSEGDGVEVDGGVALTEEGIFNNAADIITQFE